MYKRSLEVSRKRSFFLFGARATGKTTYLETIFSTDRAFFVDLLDPSLYAELQAYPEKLEPIIRPHIDKEKIIVIDEIQRVPELLNIVHSLIQKEKAKFALTGSSARKLKRGSANMLAGRASIYKMYPLLFSEIGESFNLRSALNWGTLPEVCLIDDPIDKIGFLEAYCLTYVQEEIIAEQIVRNLPPFRRFLNTAAQMHGKIVNSSKIADDINTDYSNVRNYFEILEDTLLGFRLEPYHSSIRKRQRKNPKFYWFDTGVARSLQKSLNSTVQESTSYYGDLFETFIINQIKTGLEYQTKQFELSYLLTKDGAEIDLIVERSGQQTICIEIKSGSKIRKESLKNLINLSKDIKNSKAVCLYDGDRNIKFDDVEVMPWAEGVRRLGFIV